MKMIVLILAIAMIVPTPIDEVVGGYVRLAMAFAAFVLIGWWIIDNDQKYNRIGNKGAIDESCRHRNDGAARPGSRRSSRVVNRVASLCFP